MDWFTLWEGSRRVVESIILGYSGYLFARSLLDFLRCHREADPYEAVIPLMHGIAALGAAFCLFVLSQFLRYLGDVWSYG